VLGAQARERMSLNTEEINKYDLERFNIKKPN
jgi:hypothetical protein